MNRDVIWDMGGTLVDTYPAKNAAFRDVVRSAGAEVSLSDVARLTRRSTDIAVTTLADRFGIDAELFRQANDDLKRRWERQPAPLMPGALSSLEAVTAAGGRNLVATHRDRDSAQGFIDAYDLPIAALVCAPDGYARKPDPALFRALIDSCRLFPGCCLAVGDRPIDAEAAQAVGIPVVFLATPGIALESAAEHTITHLDQLPAFLGCRES